MAKYITGVAVGLTLVYVGAKGRSLGRWGVAASIAACTSGAATSTERFKSNISTMVALPL